MIYSALILIIISRGKADGGKYPWGKGTEREMLGGNDRREKAGGNVWGGGKSPRLLSKIVKNSGLDANDVWSYRPISNLMFMSKLIERMVYQQLTAYLEKHNMLPKHQSGFHAHHSTETAILRVISDKLGAVDQGCMALLGLLDMSTAFTQLIMISCWISWQPPSGWPAPELSTGRFLGPDPVKRWPTRDADKKFDPTRPEPHRPFPYMYSL